METQERFEDGMLDVGDGHTIYWRTQGNAQAPAIVILHGGPGGAMNPQWADLLDAQKWRIVLFDQRGCGRSTPFGELRNNGLADLVGDIEALREHLGIAQWAVFGGSWGTTLGLAYGAAHPSRCLGFLLRGIYLARSEDTDWFLWGVRRVYPDVHARFLDAIEQAAGRRPASAREVLEFSGAPLSRFDATSTALARAWRDYESTLSRVNHEKQEDESDARTEEESSRAAIAMALLERHYMADELPPPALLPAVPRFAHLPCQIVHGRFDMVCPADQAQALADAWPGATFQIVDAAGHWTFDPGVATVLREAGKRLRIEMDGAKPAA